MATRALSYHWYGTQERWREVKDNFKAWFEDVRLNTRPVTHLDDSSFWDNADRMDAVVGWCETDNQFVDDVEVLIVLFEQHLCSNIQIFYCANNDLAMQVQHRRNDEWPTISLVYNGVNHYAPVTNIKISSLACCS